MIPEKLSRYVMLQILDPQVRSIF
eukprot:COSAG05_NODE_24192_length_253_cov_0.668831_1_plen_23_part_01